MSTIRRGMMRSGVDPYAGWSFGYTMGYQHPETLVANADTAVSPYFDIPAGCQRIEAKMSDGGHGNLRSYTCKADGTYRNGGSSQTSWAANITANDALVRMCVWSAEIDDCYLKDVTHNAYIWKGKNVGGVVDYQRVTLANERRWAA